MKSTWYLTTSDRIRGPIRFGKALQSSLSFLRKTCVASITQRFLVPVSKVSARNAWHNDPPFVFKMRRKPLGGTSRKIGWGYAAHLLKSLHYFRPHLWFFSLYFRPEALEPRRWRGGVEGGGEGEAVTTRTRLVGVNIKREMVLSPNDEEVASSKKHTQFKTRVTKALG